MSDVKAIYENTPYLNQGERAYWKPSNFNNILSILGIGYSLHLNAHSNI